ncbi:MAG: PadR family transcriptional regulator [Bacteroidota bacterium]
MFSKELIAASTIPIVLSLLEQGDNYGYQLIKEVQAISNNTLHWKEGSLYPVLLKMEKKGLISSYVKKEEGRNRKYYSINQTGQSTLAQLKQEWKSINRMVVGKHSQSSNAHE